VRSAPGVVVHGARVRVVARAVVGEGGGERERRAHGQDHPAAVPTPSADGGRVARQGDERPVHRRAHIGETWTALLEKHVSVIIKEFQKFFYTMI